MNLAKYLIVSGAAALDLENSYPATYFDLTNWSLQVPYSKTGSFTEGSPITIKQPDLATYTKSDLFYTKAVDGEQVMVLKTPVKGLTTSGSSHPRVELRERNGSS